MQPIMLSQIAAMLGIDLPSGGDRPITGLATLDEATETDLSFLGTDAWLPQFQQTRAAAVVVQKRVKLPEAHGRLVLIVDNADLALARTAEAFAPPVPRPPVGVDASARIGLDTQIGEGAAIGPNVVIGRRCRVGHGTSLHAGVVLADDVVVGDGCEFFPNVVVRERITIGNRVVIHASSVLGTDGFGYRWDGQQHVKIPQIGTVIIEDDVEIGSGVCIDRARFSSTRVGRGSKIDNLVQIGHNVQIGPHCIIVGQAGLAGSVRLGTGVVLGGQTAIRDHITIGDGAMTAACSAIAEDIPPKAIVSGMPALPHRQSLREQAAIRRLPDLVVQVRKLEEAVSRLKDELQAGRQP